MTGFKNRDIYFLWEVHLFQKTVHNSFVDENIVRNIVINHYIS